MARYLGMDYGLKRIGLAAGDSESKLASPVGQFDNHGSADANAAELRKYIEEYEADGLVIGLPMMEDGREAEQARLTRAFGESMQKRLAVPIEFFDERYTTHVADGWLDQRESLTNKKRRARRDALAAAAMLQSFLDQLAKADDR